MSRVASLVRFVTAAEGRTDGELLAAFRLNRDEPAFAELVRRHGPLVWGACRRILPDHADAEDAFQAAFLVLVRRAKGLSQKGTVGPWLYRVAVWTARNLRRKNARRLSRQSPLADSVPVPPTVPDFKLDIDAALLALPERYRAPLVLCHLEGLTRREAAERLGCPEGTLSSLLARGLAKLRTKLAGHELVLVAVPLLLASSTVRAACAARLAVGASVTQLMEGVLRMLWIKKATAAMTALVVVFAAGIGVGVTVRHTSPAAADEKPPQSGTVKPPAPKVDDELSALKDRLAALTKRRDDAANGVKLSEERYELMKEAAVKGVVSRAELLQELASLTRFREDIAQLEPQIADVVVQIRELDAKPAAASLSVILLDKAGGVQYRVKEYGAGGKLVGSMTVEDKAMLGIVLARTAKDPTAPKELRIVAEAESSAPSVTAVIDLAKTAGFGKVDFVKR